MVMSEKLVIHGLINIYSLETHRNELDDDKNWNQVNNYSFVGIVGGDQYTIKDQTTRYWLCRMLCLLMYIVQITIILLMKALVEICIVVV